MATTTPTPRPRTRRDRAARRRILLECIAGHVARTGRPPTMVQIEVECRLSPAGRAMILEDLERAGLIRWWRGSRYGVELVGPRD